MEVWILICFFSAWVFSIYVYGNWLLLHLVRIAFRRQWHTNVSLLLFLKVSSLVFSEKRDLSSPMCFSIDFFPDRRQGRKQEDFCFPTPGGLIHIIIPTMGEHQTQERASLSRLNLEKASRNLYNFSVDELLLHLNLFPFIAVLLGLCFYFYVQWE